MVVSIAPGCEVILSGRLDLHSVPDVRAALNAAIDAGSGDLVLDLAGVDDLDATGLGMIVAAHRRAGRSGRRLVLRDVTPRLWRILQATKLHRIIAVQPGPAR